MKEFELKLTEKEINYVLSVLGTRPFTEVADLLGKIQSQANEQITEEKK